VAIRVVRLGTRRHPKEGVRVGTVRRSPRGVPKQEYARRDFYDIWLPELAPSESLLSWARAEDMTPKRWKTFAARYAREMREPSARHLLELLAALSLQSDFSVGCYCADESQCHRSLLRNLLAEHGAKVLED
jgi:uncharacterized protein YeaO (DUF488 family)